MFGDLSVEPYSGCRQYHEDLDRARNGVPAPNIERVRVYWDHPDFLGTAAELLAESRDAAGLSSETPVLHSAHSLPLSMAASCDYQQQLNEAAAIVNELAGMRGPYEVVFQSQVGHPQFPG